MFRQILRIKWTKINFKNEKLARYEKFSTSFYLCCKTILWSKTHGILATFNSQICALLPLVAKFQIWLLDRFRRIFALSFVAAPLLFISTSRYYLCLLHLTPTLAGSDIATTKNWKMDLNNCVIAIWLVRLVVKFIILKNVLNSCWWRPFRTWRYRKWYKMSHLSDLYPESPTCGSESQNSSRSGLFCAISAITK